MATYICLLEQKVEENQLKLKHKCLLNIYECNAKKSHQVRPCDIASARLFWSVLHAASCPTGALQKQNILHATLC